MIHTLLMMMDHKKKTPINYCWSSFSFSLFTKNCSNREILCLVLLIFSSISSSNCQTLVLSNTVNRLIAPSRFWIFGTNVQCCDFKHFTVRRGTLGNKATVGARDQNEKPESLIISLRATLMLNVTDVLWLRTDWARKVFTRSESAQPARLGPSLSPVETVGFPRGRAIYLNSQHSWLTSIPAPWLMWLEGGGAVLLSCVRRKLPGRKLRGLVAPRFPFRNFRNEEKIWKKICDELQNSASAIAKRASSYKIPNLQYLRKQKKNNQKINGVPVKHIVVANRGKVGSSERRRFTQKPNERLDAMMV